MPSKIILSLQNKSYNCCCCSFSLNQTFLNLYHNLLILKRIYHKNHPIISRESEVQIEALCHII